MENFVLPYLEWEVLREPITVPKVDDRIELPKGQKKIVINRDEDYNLKATLYFKGNDVLRALVRVPDVVGALAETFDIQGGSYSDRVYYTLESCLINNATLHSGEEGQEILDTANLQFKGLRIRYRNEKEGTHLIGWCLNGPKDDVFSSGTDRKLVRNFSRERLLHQKNKINSIEVSLESRGLRTDFVQIKTGDFQFLVTKVPNGIGPSWSSNIGIEYRKAWGRIPDNDEREKIEELCSFIFGRQLLPVGYTVYDQNENIVEGYAHAPWGKHARFYCSKHDQPPIRISDGARGKAEDVLSQLLPTYYENREPLRLSEALWNYWIARQMPAGTNLPIFAAAVESILNGWFETKKSKSQRVYMKKDEFEILLEADIESIKRKLKEKPNDDKIVKNILKAYNFGIVESYRVFFEEIVLPTDAREWEAINERHKFVHGHVQFESADWKRVVQHVNTLETLFHKILLKLLGYSGTFIDRSVLGWNDKQLG